MGIIQTHLQVRPDTELEFTLWEYAKGRYQIRFGYKWAPKLSKSVNLTKPLLCELKQVLAQKRSANLHQKHLFFRHSVTVNRGAYTVIELSRNLLLFDMVLIDECFSERLFAEDVAALIEWLAKNGF